MAESSYYSQKLRFLSLAALVFSTMIGGGIFNIPQNMAAGASLGAVITSWLLTGAGVLFLIFTFRALATLKPQFKTGIYQYADAGFGRFMGFNMAWGYWFCVIISNVALGVMFNDSLGAFFPVLLKHEFPTLVLITALIWSVFALVVQGLRTASFVNTFLTIIKFGTLAFILVLLVIFFKVGMLSLDFWGNSGIQGFSDLGSIPHQVKGTMMVTMFCFLGIESAVMMSSHSVNNKDVAKASILAFILALILYTMVSVLCFGIMSQPQLSVLDDPSMAYVLKSCAGKWAYYFVICSIVLSALISWLSWTIICAETLYGASTVKMLPSQFLKLNKHGMPAYGLVISSILMSLFTVIVCTAPNVYIAALDLSILMILPPYLFSALYLCKLSIVSRIPRRTRYFTIGLITAVYCLWCMYAGGLLLLLSTSIFYASGIGFYIIAKKQNRIRTLSLNDKIGIALLILLSIISVFLIIAGYVKLR